MRDNNDFWDSIDLMSPYDFFKKKNWNFTKRLIGYSAALTLASIAFCYLFVALLVWIWY